MPRKPPAKRTFEIRSCQFCKRPYNCDERSEATCCGKSPCWEQAYWTQEQWNGRKTMADTRVVLDLPLSELDQLALEKGVTNA